MTVLLDANPDVLSVGAYDATPFGHQLQPPLSYYISSVVRPGGGTWSATDFMKVSAAPWDATKKAWMVTIFPATNYNGRERSELLLVGDRADPSNLAYTVFKHWKDDPTDPAVTPTIYYATRRVFGDATYPWSGPVAGGVVIQCKTVGYDDPNVNGTQETANYQQGPVFQILARGSDFEAETQGGILTMTFGTTGVDYVSGRRNAYGRFGGALVSGHVYDIVIEATLSLGRISAKNMPLPGSQTGGFRIWMRDFTVDQSDWNDAHLIFDSFTQAGSSGLDTIPAGAGPRAVGAIETWNYQGSSGEVYPQPSGSHPVAAAALTGGYMPPQHFTGRGIYRGGWVNGERNVHRTYVGKERICTTLAEAFALYGSGTGVPPTDSAPANTTVPGITGTVAVGQVLTKAAGVWRGTPTPTVTQKWEASDGTWWDLPGATAGTLTVTAAHVGLKLRVTEIASNSVATVQASSAETIVVPGPGGNWIGNPLDSAATSIDGWGRNQGTETLTLDTVT